MTTQASGIGAPAERTDRRIEDFGEHIPGARKDLFGSHIVRNAILGDLPQKLTDAWPAPPWEKLAEAHADENREPDELAFLRAVRDRLRTRNGWRNEHWLCRPGQDGGGLLQIALGVMNGATTVRQGLARVKALTGEPTTTDIANTTTLYRHAGHARDLGRLHCFERHGRWEIGKPVSGRTGLYRSLVEADTLAGAAKKLPEVLERVEEKAAEKQENGSSRCPYTIRWFRDPGDSR